MIIGIKLILSMNCNLDLKIATSSTYTNNIKTEVNMKKTTETRKLSASIKMNSILSGRGHKLSL